MTAGAPPSWAQYGSGIFCLANGGRDVGLIPRLDHSMSNGMAPADPVGPIDGAIQETYTLDGSDPDDAQKSISGVNVPAYAQMPVDWGFGQGLALAHLETAGALSILSGTPESLNSFATVDAMFLYPFLAKLNL
jgi:hypothetical protein